MKGFDDKNLGYFGDKYELKVINQIIGTNEEKSKGLYRRECAFGRKVLPIINAKHFSHNLAKRIVVFLKNYFNRNNDVPYYDTIQEYIKARVPDEVEQEMVFTYLNDIRYVNTTDSKWIQENTLNFINTKNLYDVFRKVENEYINRGKYNEFPQIAQMVEDALVELKDDDRLEAFVAGDYRDLENIRGMLIPTGIKALDEDMNGGLGLGELAIVVAGLKVGKAQPNNCKIYTPTGYKLMGDINVGDGILGSDGKKQTVLGVFPQGVIDYYKIEFSDNTFTYCSADHLWEVRERNSKSPIIKTLKELESDYKSKEYHIPLAGKIDFSNDLDVNSIDFDDLKGIDKILYTSYSTRLYYLINLIKRASNKFDDRYRFIIFDEEFSNQLRQLTLSLGYSFNTISKHVYEVKFEKNEKIIKNIEFVGKTECTCIKVSNSDKLYITDDFILTHNTTFASFVANNAARNGFKVLQVFFEDTVEQVKMKHRSKFTGMHLGAVINKRNKKSVGNRSDTQLKKMRDRGGCLVPHKMDSTETTVKNIAKVIKKAEERGVWFQDTEQYEKIKFDLVLIDYVDKIKPNRSYKDDWGGDKEVMSDLEKMCSRKHGLGIACWAFTQGGRSSLNSSLVSEQDVGGSIKKLQIAHFIASISKTIEQRPEGQATFAILGSRVGRDGIIYKDCTFDNGNMNIELEKVETISNFAEHIETEEAPF